MPMTDPAAPSLPLRARIWPAFGAALTLETVAIAGLLALLVGGGLCLYRGIHGL